MTTAVDIAIVGGGVAGSSLAIVLARHGCSVVVVERESAFRDRVRGEGIHPWGVAEAYRCELQHLIEASGAQPLPVWQSYTDRVPVEPFHWATVSVDGHPEFGVSHPRLQEAAIEAARLAGSTIFRPAKVIAVRPGTTPEIDLLIGSTPRTIRSRLVVGADGRNSATRKAFGAQTLRDAPHHRFGGVLIEGVALDDNAAHEASFPGGRVFVLPQGQGRARAYIVTAPDRNEDVVADHSGLAAIRFLSSLYPDGSWDAASVAGPIAFFSNADEWPERISGEGIVLIGDAAGANDPSVGNGMSLVFRDVRELSELLLSGDHWQGAVQEFGIRRRTYFDVLRHHAKWLAILTTDEGPESEARRERVRNAREHDPEAGGFGAIFARGPYGLVADDDSRRQFFGE